MSTPRPAVPFASQRLVFFALLMGMVLYTIAVAVVLQMGDGKGMAVEPIPMLDTVVIAATATLVVAAFAIRGLLRAAAERQAGAARSQARFVATMVPLALLEGACLFALTVWLLNGNAVPNLVAALVALSMAITVVPFSDPDATQG